MTKRHIRHKLFTTRYAKPALFVALFATVGAIALVTTKAATPAASIETESGSKTAKACSVNDSTASANKAVKFVDATCGGGGGGGTNPLSGLPTVPWHGGSTFFAQFPDAVSAGWDQKTFFPIGSDYDYWTAGNNTAARAQIQADKDNGINFYARGNSNQDACALRDVGGMSWVGEPGSIQNLGTCGANLWPGNMLEDEIDGTSSDAAQAFSRLNTQSTRARSQTPDKFVYTNFTTRFFQIYAQQSDAERLINGPSGGRPYADMVSSDDYVFSSPNRCSGGTWWVFIAPAPASMSHCRDPQSYGKLTDGLHMRDTGTKQPVAAITEVLGGADPSPTSIAKPETAKIEASAVSNVIHGAGLLMWFNLSFRSDCYTDRLNDISITTAKPCAVPYQQAAARGNRFVESIALWLNSQPYQWNFGAGLETRLSYYNGTVLILAMTDGTTGSRTFNLPSSIAGVSSVTEMTSGRTIPVTSGHFTDNFAANTDYRAYQVTP